MFASWQLLPIFVRFEVWKDQKSSPIWFWLQIIPSKDASHSEKNVSSHFANIILFNNLFGRENFTKIYGYFSVFSSKTLSTQCGNTSKEHFYAMFSVCIWAPGDAQWDGVRNSYKTNKNWNWIENFTLTNTLSFLLWKGLLETLWEDAVKTLNTVPSTRICTRVLGKTNDNAVIFYLDKAAVCRVNGPRTGNEKLNLIVQMNLAARLECSEVRGWKRRNLNRSLRGSFQPNILFGKM